MFTDFNDVFCVRGILLTVDNTACAHNNSFAFLKTVMEAGHMFYFKLENNLEHEGNFASNDCHIEI